MVKPNNSLKNDSKRLRDYIDLSENTKVLIGQLPDDFLRVSKPEVDPTIPQNVQEQQQNIPSIPQQVPYQSIGSAENFYSFVPPHTRGRLSIKIVEAKLTKNYGLPGHTLFETPTCVNGGKAPHWNRTVNAYLPEGVESVYLQIFDERAFTNDELVAWAHIILPQGIFNREGEGKEGVINLVVSFSQVPRPQNQGEERAIINAPLFTEEELNELAEMFPTIEREVIKQVLEAKGGVKEAAVTALLDICG
uniref:CUE domain-containing protein n=1 Tax=Meloidogyne floridensis TaxID=298350 RepID=A0A915P144_9BILA